MTWFRVWIVVGVVALTASGCGRRVAVDSAPRPGTGPATVSVSNIATQPLNVYATVNGTDIFLGLVQPNATQQLPLSSVPAGTAVTLKARTADGTRTYTRDNVVVGSAFFWTVP